MGIKVGKEALVAELRRRRFKTDGAFYFRKIAYWSGCELLELFFVGEVFLTSSGTFPEGVAAFLESSKEMTCRGETRYRKHIWEPGPFPYIGVFAALVSLGSVDKKALSEMKRENERHFRKPYETRREIYFLYDESTKVLYFPDLPSLKDAREERRMIQYLCKSALKASSKEQERQGKAKNE